MFKGFEQGRNDYQRLERRWPASTGLLIVSIFFGHKFWAWDATQMSLYWVARLPIERPSRQTSRISPTRRPERPVFVPVARNGGRRRQWKIALSLAIVGAVAAPFIFRTYNANTTHKIFVPLTAEETENLARFSYECQRLAAKRELADSDVVRAMNCRRYEQGGDYEYYPDQRLYLTRNAAAVAATFVSVFGLTFLIPMLIHGLAFQAQRYWKWLNA
jgi:hypothetical protein